ncbi:hypothetical protein RCL1_008506 [Eukaryota sp. TZLM3-RCL]
MTNTSNISLRTGVSVPRCCLVRGLSVLFDFRGPEPFDDSTVIKSFYRVICTIGSVSRSLRLITFDAIAHHLKTSSVVIPYHTHSLLLNSLHLHNKSTLFPVSYNFSLISTAQDLPLNYMELWKEFKYLISEKNFYDFCVNAESSLAFVKTLKVRCTFHTSFFRLMAMKLPSLQSLIITNPRYVEDGLYVFPSLFSNLLSLTLYLELFQYALDVANLDNLQTLDVTGITSESTKGFLIGVDNLKNLKEFNLNSARFTGELHPLARLCKVSFKHLIPIVIDAVFKNRQNYVNCRVSLHSCRVSEEIWDWLCVKVKDCLTYSSLLNKNCIVSRDSVSVFKVSSMSTLEHLHTSTLNRCWSVLDLSNCNFLHTLSLSSLVYRQNSFSIVSSTTLYISVLNIWFIDLNVLVAILEKCPYLRRLSLIYEKTVHCQTISTVISLKYLITLSLCSLEGFLSQLPVLPNLNTLVVKRIGDIDLEKVKNMCPVLQTLNVDGNNVDLCK